MVDAIQAVDIAKWRGRHCVLEDINLGVRPGEIVTILGPNGAGKSTLITILAGLVRPDTGSVRLGGEELAQLGARGRARLGVALQRYGLSTRMTVRETLTFFSQCYHGDRPVHDLLERFCLTTCQTHQIRQLSEGQKQRVSVALAFLKTFDVILLDEPMAGLDPESRRVIWDEIRQARDRGAAVLCSTHLLHEAQQHSDRILVLQAGRQLALDTPAALLQRLEVRDKIEVHSAQTIVDTIGQLPGVTCVLHTGQTATLYCHDAPQAMRELLARDALPHVSWGPLSLEDVFDYSRTERSYHDRPRCVYRPSVEALSPDADHPGLDISVSNSLVPPLWWRPNACARRRCPDRYGT